jgi:hypothetical protein
VTDHAGCQGRDRGEVDVGCQRPAPGVHVQDLQPAVQVRWADRHAAVPVEPQQPVEQQQPIEPAEPAQTTRPPRAGSNRSRTRLAPTPTIASMNSAAERGADPARGAPVALWVAELGIVRGIVDGDVLGLDVKSGST